jgi:hypothetical protein
MHKIKFRNELLSDCPSLTYRQVPFKFSLFTFRSSLKFSLLAPRSNFSPFAEPKIPRDTPKILSDSVGDDISDDVGDLLAMMSAIY